MPALSGGVRCRLPSGAPAELWESSRALIRDDLPTATGSALQKFQPMLVWFHEPWPVRERL